MMRTYDNTTYILEYPDNWSVSEESNDEVQFHAPGNDTAFFHVSLISEDKNTISVAQLLEQDSDFREGRQDDITTAVINNIKWVIGIVDMTQSIQFQPFRLGIAYGTGRARTYRVEFGDVPQRFNIYLSQFNAVLETFRIK